MKGEREAVAAYLKQHNLRDYALFAVGVCAWWQLPDLLALNVNDVAYIDNEQKMSVKESVTIKRTGQSKPLSGAARRALASYLNKRGKAAPMELDEPLFKCDRPRRGGADRWRMTIPHAGRVLTEAARACGLPCQAGGQVTLDYFTADYLQKEINEAIIGLSL